MRLIAITWLIAIILNMSVLCLFAYGIEIGKVRWPEDALGTVFFTLVLVTPIVNLAILATGGFGSNDSLIRLFLERKRLEEKLRIEEQKKKIEALHNRINS
jgi:hypothetical protein